jgi:hypothetical protein
MTRKERLAGVAMFIAVLAALVSAGGIGLSIGGLLLSENDLTGLGVGMIVFGSLTYIAILNWLGNDT